MIGRQVTLDELEDYLKTLRMERSVRKVIVHHFWQPCASEWQGLQTLQSVWSFHTDTKGWGDIGYHLVIGPDDSIWLARPMEAAGAHTIGQNNDSIGLAYAANFDEEAPEMNGYKTGVMACAKIARRFSFSANEVFFHRDFADKSCPGTNMDRDKFRLDVAEDLEG